jgi:simple sugar transport system substrate-binding protein/ribose transport system substrate-binding protein
MVRRKPGFGAAVAVAALALACSSCTSGKSATPDTTADPSASTSAGTGTLAGFTLADHIKGHVKDKKKLKFVYITNDLSSSYTSAQKAGVEKAVAELGVEAELQGPPTGKAEDQVALVQTLIAQKQVDGIVVAAVNVDSLKPVIQQAFDAGIPFISAFTDQPNSKQLSFVGADNTQFGKELGQRLAKQLSGKSGKVVAVSVDTAAGWSTARMDGLKQGLADNPGLEFVGPINTTIEQGQMYNAIQNAMTANPDAIAIASVDCCSIDGAAKWVETSKKTGAVAVTGTDALQQTLDYIDKGVIGFSLSQDPVGQVFTSIKQIKDYIVDGTPPQRTILPALLVDKSNAGTVTPEG